MSRKAAIVCLFAMSALAGCRAYRVKKAEFMRNDARSIADPMARVRALVDADCFVEVGKAPADAPEMMACRKTAGTTRLGEAASAASGDEAATFGHWRDCFSSTDGSTAKWSSCRTQAEAAVADVKVSHEMPSTSTVADVVTSTVP